MNILVNGCFKIHSSRSLLMKRCLFAIAFVVFFSVFQYAQTVSFGPPPFPAQAPKVDPAKEAEKLAKQVTLAEQALADAQGLRLGENRAFVFAKTGTLLWKSDKKAAQEIFQRAINELGTAQMTAEAEEVRKTNFQNDLRLIQMVRPTILSTIGACDAEFALDAMYRTRTASIQKALAIAAEPTTTRISDLNGVSLQLARAELNLEQRLIGLAIEQNPERSAKLVQETIRKGLSNETLSLLKRLYVKDSELATSLAVEVLDKLLSTSFTPSPTNQAPFILAFAILNDSLRTPNPNLKELRFEESGLRSLASKLISQAISPDRDVRYNYGMLPQLIKIAEKYTPLSVAALKKQEKTSMPPGARSLPASDARRLASMTAPQLLAEAKKLPVESRSSIYQNAANKMSQTGDYNGALDLLNLNFSGQALDHAVNSLNWYYVAHLMNQAKWDEAERLIDQFPDSNKRSALIALATRSFAKDPAENKSYALSVLSKLRSMMPDKPSDQTEMNQVMQLAEAYAGIEPDEAFNTFDPMMPMLNELADANAIVQGFQHFGNVKMGEFLIIHGGNWGFHFDPNLLRSLAKADFDRTTKLIDRFSRREMRIALKLQVAENGLN